MNDSKEAWPPRDKSPSTCRRVRTPWRKRLTISSGMRSTAARKEFTMPRFWPICWPHARPPETVFDLWGHQMCLQFKPHVHKTECIQTNEEETRNEYICIYTGRLPSEDRITAQLLLFVLVLWLRGGGGWPDPL